MYTYVAGVTMEGHLKLQYMSQHTCTLSTCKYMYISAFKEYWGRLITCDNSYIASSASDVSALLVCTTLQISCRLCTQ